MPEKEKFVCRECDLNCEIKAEIHMEEDWPHHCPFGVLHYGGYVNEPKWKKRVKR